MKTLLSNWKSNWNFFRAIRLFLGIAVIIKGIADSETLFAIAGGFLALMALVNIGCCGAGGCAVPPSSHHVKTSKENEIVYEKVDSTK